MKMQILLFKEYQEAEELGEKNRLFRELLRQSGGCLKNIVSFYLENLNCLQVRDFYKLVNELREAYYDDTFRDLKLAAEDVSVDNQNCRDIERVLFYGYHSEDVYLGSYLENTVALLRLFNGGSAKYLNQLKEYFALLERRKQVAASLGKHLFLERWQLWLSFEEEKVLNLELSPLLEALAKGDYKYYRRMLRYDPRVALQFYSDNAVSLSLHDLFRIIHAIKMSCFSEGWGLFLYEPTEIKSMLQYCYDIEGLLSYFEYKVPFEEWHECALAIQDFFLRFLESNEELPSQFPGYKELLAKVHARTEELAQDERYKQKIWARREMGH